MPYLSVAGNQPGDFPDAGYPPEMETLALLRKPFGPKKKEKT